jgi:hypothetical protein
MHNYSTESRYNKRYSVLEKVIGISADDIFQLTDISAGGLAIKCRCNSKLPPKCSIDIVIAKDRFHATIPVKLVWEKETQPSPYVSMFTKYVGLQFDDLTKENKSKIEYLIKMHEALSSKTCVND